MITLTKGKSVELGKGVKKVKIDLTWTPSRKAQAYDLDIMALELNDEDYVAQGDKSLVFYNQLQDSTGALTHSGDDRTGEGDGEEMNLDVTKLHESVSKVLFILNIFESGKNHQNFGEIHNIKLRIFYDGKEIPDLVYNLEEEESHKTATVLKIFSIYKSGQLWKVKAINEGITSTLSSVVQNYGLTSNDNSI